MASSAFSLKLTTSSISTRLTALGSNRDLSETKNPTTLNVSKKIPNWNHHFFVAPIQRTRPVSASLFTKKTQHDSSRPSDLQELHVYEINEGDRGSPVYLHLSKKEINSLGDLIPFSNKLYSGNLEKRFGITAGITIFIQNVPEKNGDRYEAIYSFYFGNYGHISVQGAYLTYQDSYLSVTGGSGVFAGAYGQVLLHQIVFPFKIYYTFYLQGIPDLPVELLSTPVKPSVTVEPTPAAKACEPHAALKDFTD